MDSTPHAIRNTRKIGKIQNTYTENTKKTENPEYLYGKKQKTTENTENTENPEFEIYLVGS